METSRAEIIEETTNGDEYLKMKRKGKGDRAIIEEEGI